MMSGTSKEDYLTEIRKLSDVLNKKITRSDYRKHSELQEQRWIDLFGTFREFKRQAGLDASRTEDKHQSNIAKHASVDELKQLNTEKRNWSSTYLKPSGTRFQTVLVGSDIHDIECDPFWRKLFISTAERVQPEKIVLNGDIFDLPEFSKYTVDPREWDVVGRIRWVHAFLDDLRRVCPNAEIIFIEGNHEFRLLRFLSETAPQVKSILHDLHHMTIPGLLGLEKYEVNYIAPADLGVFTKADHAAELRRNWTTLYDCLIAHHFPDGANFGLPGWNGHHHTHKVFTYFSALIGSFEWHQLGSGHKRQASYCNGEKWSNGFLMVHVDTLAKKSQFEYIDCSHDHCIIGGKWYIR